MSRDSARERWNRRYADGDSHATPVPNQFLLAEARHLAPGRALDLACGAGRNAVWLAERGWRVTAVDFSAAGLAIARELAVSRAVTVEWLEADLIDWTPAPRAYDLVCALYVQIPAAERRVALERATDALAPGGTLLVIGHDLSNLTEGSGGPGQRDVLLVPDEIAAELSPLRIEKAGRVHRPVEDPAVRPAIDALVRATRPR